MIFGIERKEGVIVKDAAKTHLTIFTEGVNACSNNCRSSSADEDALEPHERRGTEFGSVLHLTNSKAFQQTLRKKSATPRRHQVDV